MPPPAESPITTIRPGAILANKTQHAKPGEAETVGDDNERR